MSSNKTNMCINLNNELTNNHKLDVFSLIDKKIDFFYDVIQKTIIHIQKNKKLDILGIADVSLCVEKMNDINLKLDTISTKLKTIDNKEELINELQTMNNEFSILLKNFGTYKLEDLIVICFGTSNKITITSEDEYKLKLLNKYFHPTGYKVIHKKEDVKNKKTVVEFSNDEKMNNLDCGDISSSVKQFHLKVHGMKVYIKSDVLHKNLLIYGFLDDILIDYINNPYVLQKKKELQSKKEFDKECYENYVNSLSLKDYLMNNTNELINKFMGITSHVKIMKQKQISVIVKEFISEDIYTKRNILTHLLINSDNFENMYLSYLLYDLLSNDTNGTIDTQEQSVLFDSLPWSIKQHFKNAMKKTIQYTNELHNFDMNKIPLEQQICLLKAPDSVKEKAMIKLKEVKAKSEDSGTKARQYLDALLRIPFGIYKKEPILLAMNEIRIQFKEFLHTFNIKSIWNDIPEKEKYTSIEILNYLKKIKDIIEPTDTSIYINKLKAHFVQGNKQTLKSNLKFIKEIFQKRNKVMNNANTSVTLNKVEFICEINHLLDLCNLEENREVLSDFLEVFYKFCSVNGHLKNAMEMKKPIVELTGKMQHIHEYMKEVKHILDESVYGHNKSKRHIERVIAQWINGEDCSHVLGFEGNPGIGKTTLAKGLANCLKDENGSSRPYAFIALGGDANASYLTGHSYTYVGAQHSQIIQILMDKKCMNPIIVLDEVDKISKTENGKEITGILTHLLDPTQNSAFQDKYFAGIDIDLSKVLFILSYNDVDLIDKILLDRIQRIKFDTLSIEDKIVIAQKHLLPELYGKIGLDGMIHIPDKVIQFIIEEYTLEPGVRKLKEKLFDIVGEINLAVFTEMDNSIEIPIEITIEDVKQKYFKESRQVKVHKIHESSQVGLINALWANHLSQGGVLPLQASFVPSSKFLDLTLTGSMGDVMKESVSVSLTNAWNLTSEERKKYLIEKHNDPKNNRVNGIHIHCPDISTKKDGPSATTAFTVLIYSLLNNIKIKHNFGITGETHMGYVLTEIGGLQEKIIHSIKSGITEFIFPKENQKDFDKIMEKYKDNPIIQGIHFHSVSHINDVFDLILEKEQ